MLVGNILLKCYSTRSNLSPGILTPPQLHWVNSHCQPTIVGVATGPTAHLCVCGLYWKFNMKTVERIDSVEGPKYHFWF